MKWLGTVSLDLGADAAPPRRTGGPQVDVTILDTDDQIRLLKQIIDAENIDEKRWPARALAGLIDGWKNRALTPDRVPKDETFAYADGKGARLYDFYQQRCAS